MEQLRKDDRSLFEKIIDFFKNLFTASKGTQFEQDVKAIYDRLNGLLERADKNSADTRHSIAKSSKGYYNEFNTLAMQWAYSASTKPGDVKIFNNKGKYFTLIEATEDGYVELASGNYEEVKSEYDRIVQEQTDSFNEVVESFKFGREQYSRNSFSGELGRRNVQDGGPAGSQGIQDNAGGNRTDMLRGDKGLSQSAPGQEDNIELTVAKDITKTNSFRKWFGDSRAVNKDGTAKKLYHRTNADFTAFDTSKSGSNQGKTKGDGIYLSSSKDEFSYAGDKIMELYAKIENPFEMELSNEQANAIYDKYFKPYHNDIYNTYRPHVISSLTNPVKVFDYLEEAAETNNTKTSEILTELGYDGVHSGSEWVAFYPEQIKSADPVTYDDNGNVIPLSERFNQTNPDIRYSKGYIDILQAVADGDMTVEEANQQIQAGKQQFKEKQAAKEESKSVSVANENLKFGIFAIITVGKTQVFYQRLLYYGASRIKFDI